MPEKLHKFDAADFINTEESAKAYLEECSKYDPGDGSHIRDGLKTVARSRNMSKLARDTGLDRAALYRALSEKGNPSFATVLKVLQALDLRLRIVPTKRRAQASRAAKTTSAGARDPNA